MGCLHVVKQHRIPKFPREWAYIGRAKDHDVDHLVHIVVWELGVVLGIVNRAARCCAVRQQARKLASTCSLTNAFRSTQPEWSHFRHEHSHEEWGLDDTGPSQKTVRLMRLG
jgi:hypothetical protein